MRVAIFAETYYPFISGVVTHIDTLRRGLEAEGHKVLIVTLDPKAKKHYVKDNVLYCPAISLKKIYGYGLANPVNLQRLKIVESFDPDIIHIHTEFSMGIFAMFAAKQLKKPVVYTLHTMYDEYIFYLFPEKINKMSNMAKPAAHAYIRKMAAKSTEIIGPSVKVANYLHKCGVKRHINIVPNTVDLSNFMEEIVDKKAIEEVRGRLGIKQNDVAICFVGRLGNEKSIDVLINYFTECFKGQEEFKLFIIGDGPDKAALEEQVRNLGIENQVNILGRIEHNELPKYYRSFDLFATASLTEMNSISLLEATASGLYAVQRLDIYNRDQITPGQNGDVFDSPQEFGKIVSEYAALNAEERTQRKKSVSDFATKYGPKEFTAKITNVYERAIDEFFD